MERRGRVYFDEELAGWLEETPGGVRFRYDQRWLERPDATPISLSLPLRSEAWEWSAMHPFFVGLLPEGWLLRLGLAKLKLSEDDVFGLVLALCRDCVGAVRILPDESEAP